MSDITQDELPEALVHRPGQTPARRTLFGYVTPDHPRMDRLQNAISGVCAVLASAAIVIIVVLTTVEVISRTGFGAPLGWNVGFVEQYLMMAIAFFGTVTAYRTGAHVAVVTIFERLPVPARKLLLVLTYLIILLGLVLLVYSGARATEFAFTTGQQPQPGQADLPWPAWWWKAIIPAAASLGIVVVLIDLLKELMSPLRTVSTDYDPEHVAEEF
ncbi:TRAP transporter small permease [Tomitella gaofuii]|uniref:TRAP transporter small permease n=1 Tax=Tomitella gaofuii TaxID=2760083 RepID=UPI0015FE6324|nr:TRAP transporter small permease [Tomitella gaofuii]